MKILHLSTHATGGAGIAAIRLHKLLLSQGVDSSFLSLGPVSDIENASSYTPTLGSFTRALNKWYQFADRGFQSQYFFNGPRSLYRLSRHPLVKQADVIHLHWVVKFIHWPDLFSLKNKRFVWTLHDMNPFTGGEHYKMDVPPDTIQFRKLAARNMVTKREALKGVDLNIVTPSKWLGEISCGSELFSKFPHEAIMNPIPLTLFRKWDKGEARKVFGLPLDKKIVLFLAEKLEDKRKGIYLLKDALQGLATDGVEFVSAGSGAIDFPGVQIRSLGTVQGDEKLAQLYSSADVFLMPSLEDNLPNTINESLACGTPVVCFNVGGMPEMVKNGINGMLVEKGDASGLINGVKMLLDHPLPDFNARTHNLLNEDELFGRFMRVYNR